MMRTAASRAASWIPGAAPAPGLRAAAARTGVRTMATEHFPGIGKIKYEGPDTKSPLAFKWYNADEKIMGKTMKEHLRFSVWYARSPAYIQFGDAHVRQ